MICVLVGDIEAGLVLHGTAIHIYVVLGFVAIILEVYTRTHADKKKNRKHLL
jgi:hypothetical protein